MLGWALLHGCPIPEVNLKQDYAWGETLRTRLIFLTCVAHQQNKTNAPAGSLGQLSLNLPQHVIQHIARFL